MNRSRVSVKRIAVVLVAVILATQTAAAQQKRDSVDARRKAVTAQARFEMVRRSNLPLSYSGTGGDCDARIGRFCQWNSEDDTSEAKEPRVIRRARLSLIATLDSEAKRSPRDGWISGQRVRYLLESRNDTAAIRAARECRASEWWCAALEGLALHESGAGVVSDSAFARALRAMPSDERCRWTDMSPILDPSLRRKFGKVGCDRNPEIAERLWWLADPFWSIDGNDRRTEHFARHTMARILEPARNAYNLSWSNDLREMVVRYGWARYWTRAPGSSYEPLNGAVSGHEATPNYHFVPVSLSLDSIPRVSFDLDLDASAERYAPAAAHRVVELDPQVAVFRRGDSALVVAAYDITGRPNFDSTAVSAALVLAVDEKSALRKSVATERRGAVAVLTDSRPQLLSLEVVNVGGRAGAAWKRTGLRVTSVDPGAVTLSDPLLFRPEAEVTNLQQAMTLAIGGPTVHREKMGIYWETYGLAKSDTAQPVSLTLTRVQQGALQKLGESIGLASRMSPLRIQWNQVPGGSVTSRAVVLDLSLIPRGKYVLRIETGSASTTRALEIR